MKKNVREKMPLWANDDLRNYLIRMSNDIDSWSTSVILNKMFGLKVNQFYNFKELWQLHKTEKEHINIDIAIEEGKTFDNHVTIFHLNDRMNNESFNINNVRRINRSDYTNKYAGSTLLQVVSFYKPFDLYSLSDEQKMVLWAIDTGFKGYFSPSFKETHKHYTKLLELEPIADVLNKYSRSEFYDIIKKYNLHEEIYIEDGKLNTKIELLKLSALFNLDFTLPSETFTRIETFETYYSNELYQKTYNKSNPNLFSFALTGKNEVNCSVRIS